jgi:hypothetical protein
MKQLTSALFVLLFLQSCQHDGCDDLLAKNYDSKVTNEKYACCCLYEGNIGLWFNASTSDSLVANGIDSLFLFVNDVLMDSTSVQNFQTNSTNCMGSLNAVIDLSSSKALSKTYRVRPQSANTGISLFIGEPYVEGGKCFVEELVW